MDNQKKHYFFKHGPTNAFFKESIKGIQNGAPLPLSIFFNKHGDWTFENHDMDKSAINNGKAKLQIKTFFEAAKDKNTVFWLFDDLLYALIPQSKVYNGTITNAIKDSKYGQPKTINVTVFDKFEKKYLPEAFASINSYQKYNRKTIVKLEKPEKEIAEWVYNHGSNCKMLIPKEKRFDYLSPLQCETLIFLIFHHNKIFCTTYRGGTREGVDFNGAPEGVLIEGMHLNGSAMVQVKKCDCRDKHQDGIVLVHLGDSVTGKPIYGKDWIERCLKKLPDVEIWLNKSLDFFKISDEI